MGLPLPSGLLLFVQKEVHVLLPQPHVPTRAGLPDAVSCPCEAATAQNAVGEPVQHGPVNCSLSCECDGKLQLNESRQFLKDIWVQGCPC